MSDEDLKAAREAAKEATNNGTNVQEVERIVAEANRDIDDAEAEMEALKADVRMARARVKGAGIKMAEFNYTRRLRQLEAEDRDEAIDKLKVCFSALGVGQQGELFAAAADAQTETAEARVH